jgi:CHAT domain-containing protein
MASASTASPRLHDIFNMKLSAEIVALSACQTALGRDVRGEGLIGLTRGFMHAGASQVVASLWDVRDRSTATLMTELYSGLLQRGLTAPAALRATQIAMWKNPRWRAPVHWAGFIAQGDWRTAR